MAALSKVEGCGTSFTKASEDAVEADESAPSESGESSPAGDAGMTVVLAATVYSVPGRMSTPPEVSLSAM